jgi:hypothetical protein
MKTGVSTLPFGVIKLARRASPLAAPIEKVVDTNVIVTIAVYSIFSEFYAKLYILSLRMPKPPDLSRSGSSTSPAKTTFTQKNTSSPSHYLKPLNAQFSALFSPYRMMS